MMRPKFVAKAICSGRSSGTRIPSDAGRAPFAHAPRGAIPIATISNAPTANRTFVRRCATMLTIEFDTFELANGLTVILHVDRSSPLVAVDLWYHVGSKDEVPGRTGFAHLFEHL